MASAHGGCCSLAPFPTQSVQDTPSLFLLLTCTHPTFCTPLFTLASWEFGETTTGKVFSYTTLTKTKPTGFRGSSSRNFTIPSFQNLSMPYGRRTEWRDGQRKIGAFSSPALCSPA